MMNRLADESSLYLRQHAYQPVHWYPWCEEAFDLARQRSCPVLISIGYSACHWCHVMARESFQDQEIAETLNKNFVSIKVDREEHPEVDSIYMLACEVATGSGGWPLTVFALPDGAPFLVTTYLPPDSYNGRMGFRQLIEQISMAWTRHPEKIQQAGKQFLAAMDKVEFYLPDNIEPSAVIKDALNRMATEFDHEFGGFGHAPKFPSPLRLLFLLSCCRGSGELGPEDRKQAGEMAFSSLSAMRYSGLFDHVDGAFHRYCVDQAWKVPHFEKMLYDQALMMMAYAEAYEISGEPYLADTVDRIFSYLQERMLSPDGLFYSAESAESQGEEGVFYSYGWSELEQILAPDQMKLFAEYFSLDPDGNYFDEATGVSTGRNLLHPVGPPEFFAKEKGLSPEEFSRFLRDAMTGLKQARDLRIRPDRDEKLMVDWNSLAAMALARSGTILDRPDLLKAGQRVMQNMVERGFSNSRLLHLIDAKRTIPGLLEDYLFMAVAAHELWLATGDDLYGGMREQLLSDAAHIFPSGKAGTDLLRQVPKDYQPPLFYEYIPIFDGAVPSGNGMLALLFARTGQHKNAIKVMEAVGKQMQTMPGQFPSMLLALVEIYGNKP